MRLNYKGEKNEEKSFESSVYLLDCLLNENEDSKQTVAFV